MSRNIQPTEDLTAFLNDVATFEEIEKIADKQDILVRRYDCLSVVIGIVLVTVLVTCRFIMCYLVYTNFQREGAIMNMTAVEVMGATRTKVFHVIAVWEHKTAASHGPAKVAVKENIYKLLVEHMGIEQDWSRLGIHDKWW